MHAAAISWMIITIAGQAGGDFGGGYNSAPAAEYGPRMSVSAGAKTRSTRATSPLTNSYPPMRVATSPRYAEAQHEGSLPPVGDSNRTEDPYSALADKLLREMIQPAAGEQNVRALRLVDALERTSGSQQQFTAIKAYWDWSAAVSELYGVDEENHLLHNSKNAPRNRSEQAAQTANLKASRARLEDTKLDVAAKVVDLLEVTNLRSTSASLRPADVPFVSAYNTNFSKLFPNGSGPTSLKKINQTLPYALKVVRSRADSYEASRQALLAAQSALQAQQCPYDDFLNALALMRSQRRAFLDSVHDYNFAIAEYALSVAGPGMRRETVVSMLIRPVPTTYRGASLDYSREIMPAAAYDDGSADEYGGYSQGSYDTYLVPALNSRSNPVVVSELGEPDVRRSSSATLMR